MFTVYVLFSKKFDKIYIGQTSDINIRFNEHNMGLSKHTKKYIPWEIIHTEPFETRKEALYREKQLKSSRGRSFIWREILGIDKF